MIDEEKLSDAVSDLGQIFTVPLTDAMELCLCIPWDEAEDIGWEVHIMGPRDNNGSRRIYLNRTISDKTAEILLSYFDRDTNPVTLDMLMRFHGTSK